MEPAQRTVLLPFAKQLGHFWNHEPQTGLSATEVRSMYEPQERLRYIEDTERPESRGT